MMKNVSWVILVCVVLVGCSTKKTSLRPGEWRATVASPGGELPFGLEIRPNADSSTYTVHVLNASERLSMDTTLVQGDSVRIPMGLFEAEIVAKIEDKTLTGYWRRKRTKDTYVSLPFRAEWGQTYRFVADAPEAKHQLAGKWATNFYTDQDTTVAVGVFEQQGNRVKGTFLTTTGDYRYLDGNVVGDSLMLSTFDGTHLFLFKAKINADAFEGGFYSGTMGYERMVATRNPEASLPDLSKLTYLKPGYDAITFSFPDAVTGQQVSISDQKYKDKVVVVQILGSWCPNCMDESRFLAPWYQQNKSRGVEVIGLAYEKTSDRAVSGPKLERMKQRFGIEYAVLLAGINDKDSASASLPMLNRVLAFPTTIFVDKKGKVRGIHTGFAGPGTGVYYDRLVEDFNRLIDKLVAE